jgi:CheY-like chemotaxis protein
MIRILLADHDAFFRSMYARVFERSSFEVAVAEDGGALLRKARSDLPDAIVMELALPQTDGFRALEELRSHAETAKIPVVLLTSLSERSDVERCERLGCDRYFIKPHARPDSVVGTVLELVGTAC